MYRHGDHVVEKIVINLRRPYQCVTFRFEQMTERKNLFPIDYRCSAFVQDFFQFFRLVLENLESIRSRELINFRKRCSCAMPKSVRLSIRNRFTDEVSVTKVRRNAGDSHKCW